MKKEKQEISINTSSGAEKVERIEKEIKKSGGTKTATRKSVQSSRTVSAKGEAAVGGSEKKTVKKTAIKESEKKAEKERDAAKSRVDAALKRKERAAERKAARAARAAKKKEIRAKRAAEKKAMIEKRAAEKKALIEKRAAAKKALAEKRKAAKEAKIRERAHAKANRNQAQQRKKQKKNEDKREKSSKKERSKGYGGWIAAVVTLGVTTLALASTVTVGAIEMRKTSMAAMTAQRGTMYELTGIMEHVDDDLDRVRVSASPVQQSRILTDLLVQTRLAELDLEKLPIEAQSDRNVTEFINRTARECERMLAKLRNGGELSTEDFETLERLYATNHAIRSELDKVMEEMTDDDLMEFMKKGAGKVTEAIERIEKSTLEENRAALEGMIKKKMGEMKGAGMERTAPAPEKNEEARIEPAKAEALCQTYFSDYKIEEYQCVGETVTRTYAAYNVQGYDDKGTLLFAEISQKDGALLRFDYYEDCETETYDLQNAERIAEAFLDKLGYEDMEIARFRENGTMTDFTFVYEADDVAYYPDEIHVKICRSRGVVTGMDATKYIQNHKDRSAPNAKITLADAYDRLHDKLHVETSKLAVISTARGERTAYEFLCSYGEENYFVYLDAVTGEEISIVNARAIQ